jgi:3-hydroxybenzoate/4-hydroxybenzoate---CoA ligase
MNAAQELLARSFNVSVIERPAILYKDRVISFRDFHLRVEIAAGVLNALGVVAGDRVAVLLEDSSLFASLVYGAMKIGAVVVPLNTQLRSKDYLFILSDSRAKIAICEPAVALEMSSVKASTQIIQAPAFVQLLRTGAAIRNFAPVQANDPCVQFYLLGPSGRPRAVIHSQASVAASSKLWRESVALTPQDRVLSSGRLFDPVAFDTVLMGALAQGAAIIINPSHPSSEFLVDRLFAVRPTVFIGFPGTYRDLANWAELSLLESKSEQRTGPNLNELFRSVRLCLSTAERIDARLAIQWRKLCSHSILEFYATPQALGPVFAGVKGPAGSCGQTLSGVETRLLNAQQQEIDADEIGILWVKHPQAPIGASVVTSVAPNAVRANEWMCTGDYFRMGMQGEWYFEGRSRDAASVSGQLVIGQHIEHAALRAGALDVSCIALADANGFDRLILFAVVSEETRPGYLNEAGLVEFLVKVLPETQRPKRVFVVPKIPRTSQGAVDRSLLKNSVLDEQRAMV